MNLEVEFSEKYIYVNVIVKHSTILDEDGISKWGVRESLKTSKKKKVRIYFIYEGACNS